MTTVKLNSNEDDTVIYKVIYGKDVLFESTTIHGAESFVARLSNDVQGKIKIMPTTLNGLQVLLG